MSHAWVDVPQPNNRPPLDAAASGVRRHRSPRRSLRPEVAIDTAWQSWFSDQALRVAAGIPRKHVSDGLWSSGHYCPGCGAFPEM
jgi:hypothetical protein